MLGKAYLLCYSLSNFSPHETKLPCLILLHGYVIVGNPASPRWRKSQSYVQSSLWGTQSYSQCRRKFKVTELYTLEDCKPYVLQYLSSVSIASSFHEEKRGCLFFLLLLCIFYHLSTP